LKLLKSESVYLWICDSVADPGIVEQFQSLCGTSDDMNNIYMCVCVCVCVSVRERERERERERHSLIIVYVATNFDKIRSTLRAMCYLVHRMKNE